MLEKYLPFLKFQQSTKKLPSTELYPQESVQSNLLFYDPQKLKKDVNVADKVVGVASSLIIFFSAVLILMLIAHTTINFLLNDLVNEQKNIEYKINGLADVEKRAEAVVRRIDYYKMTVEERKSLTTKISFILSRVPSNLSIATVEFNKAGFDIVVKGEKPLYITQMFMSWLKDGGVKEVSLKDAVFSSSENIYMVRIGGTFR